MSKIQIVRQHADKVGAILLSKRCVSFKTKLEFECPSCHNVFKRSWTSFKNSETGLCHKCSCVTGTDHPQFKDLSPEEKAARNPKVRLAKHKIWEKKVFEKDSHRCVISGRKTNLVAHHVEGWAENPELREVPENGVTLTKKLHDKFHNQFGPIATKKDWEQFYIENSK